MESPRIVARGALFAFLALGVVCGGASIATKSLVPFALWVAVPLAGLLALFGQAAIVAPLVTVLALFSGPSKGEAGKPRPEGPVRRRRRSYAFPIVVSLLTLIIIADSAKVYVLHGCLVCGRRGSESYYRVAGIPLRFRTTVSWKADCSHPPHRDTAIDRSTRHLLIFGPTDESLPGFDRWCATRRASGLWETRWGPTRPDIDFEELLHDASDAAIDALVSRPGPLDEVDVLRWAEGQKIPPR